jgi:hypothetical protein
VVTASANQYSIEFLSSNSAPDSVTMKLFSNPAVPTPGRLRKASADDYVFSKISTIQHRWTGFCGAVAEPLAAKN